MDSAVWPATDASGPSHIPDVRGTGLGKLARRYAAGEKAVTGVVSRIAPSQEKNSAVSFMSFNSSI